MKRRWTVRFALLCLALASFCSSVSAASDTGWLVIRRSADFGTRLALRIWIDGTPVASIPLGHDFNARIPAGRHVISVMAVPNRWDYRPTHRPLIVRPGRTYRFTALWFADQVFLR
jgi:hypothetical protein